MTPAPTRLAEQLQPQAGTVSSRLRWRDVGLPRARAHLQVRRAEIDAMLFSVERVRDESYGVLMVQFFDNTRERRVEVGLRVELEPASAGLVYDVVQSRDAS